MCKCELIKDDTNDHAKLNGEKAIKSSTLPKEIGEVVLPKEEHTNWLSTAK